MDESMRKETIVVIDDDPVMRLSCRKILSKAGFLVETYEDGAGGLEGLSSLKPALALVDLKMPGISGMEVICRVHGKDPSLIIVVITGYATIGTAVEAMKAGAYDFLPKPFSAEELRVIVNRGLEHRRLLVESKQLEVERELLKRRFVTFVSHQLKSPLVAIHQYLEVMKCLGDSPEVTDKRSQWLDRCLKRADEMLELIQDWLTLSRVESGSLSQNRVEVDLRPLILGVLDQYQPLAERSRVSLEAEFQDDEYRVFGDRNCLNVLLDNLIENAVKYNKPNGKVTVRVERDPGEIVVSVIDTGVGIPEKSRCLLFDEFFRVAGQGSAEGTGLGLAICHKIVSELGGRITVESELGVGSTFRVRLPARQLETTERLVGVGSGRQRENHPHRG